MNNYRKYPLLKNCLATLVIGSGKFLYLLIANPSISFVFTLTIFIFVYPSKSIPPLDRVAFFLLFMLTLMAYFFRRERILIKEPIIIPMVALTILAAISALNVPFSFQTWSLVASKFIVPFTMFFLAKMVFRDDRSVQHFFFFSVLVTAYLIFTSIASLLDVRFLIFPRYILDINLGPLEHLERARGPFLNAIPNGTAVIILGLSSLHWFQKKGFRGSLPLLFLIGIPFAILATMTRSVWLSFAFCVAFLIINTRNPKMRKVGLTFLVLSFISVSMWFITSSREVTNHFLNRTHNKKNIDFRLNLYKAGFEMFRERPILGWGTNQTPFIISRYLSNYKDDVWVHNTYAEILMEHGIVGLILYSAIVLYLFKIGSRIFRLNNRKKSNLNMIDEGFVFLWRIILGVYLINGIFAVMNYQFINALLFTIAGIISATESQLGVWSIKTANQSS